jgi:hypothetical protein
MDILNLIADARMTHVSCDRTDAASLARMVAKATP